MTIEQRMRSLIDDGTLDLPPLGEGETAERFARLAAIARDDVAVARLAEAHVDAVQILRESGRAAQRGAWYGVWAADDPSATTVLDGAPTGGATLTGAKSFCTGATMVDRALVTVRTPEVTLVDVDLRNHRDRITADSSGWVTPAFAGTGTATVAFADVPIAADGVIGEHGWYLDRVGFWDGACGPAACWVGGALGLVDLAVDRARRRTTGGDAAVAPSDVIDDVAIGALTALAYQMSAVLDRAGRDIDAGVTASVGAHGAHIRALQVRHSIERSCTEVVDRFTRSMGPRPMAFDETAMRRLLEVQLYVRQCHAERDLSALGRAVLGSDSG